MSEVIIHDEVMKHKWPVNVVDPCSTPRTERLSFPVAFYSYRRPYQGNNSMRNGTALRVRADPEATVFLRTAVVMLCWLVLWSVVEIESLKKNEGVHSRSL